MNQEIQIGNDKSENVMREHKSGDTHRKIQFGEYIPENIIRNIQIGK